MSDVIDPIVPRRWIPPFFRDQAVAEEVVETRVQVVGEYDRRLISNRIAVYYDKQLNAAVTLIFEDGLIRKSTVMLRHVYKSVALGDDGRVYDSSKGQTVPHHVRVLAWDIERDEDQELARYWDTVRQRGHGNG